jgi:hypothetical protein
MTTLNLSIQLDAEVYGTGEQVDAQVIADHLEAYFLPEGLDLIVHSIESPKDSGEFIQVAMSNINVTATEVPA